MFCVLGESVTAFAFLLRFVAFSIFFELVLFVGEGRCERKGVFVVGAGTSSEMGCLIAMLACDL